MPSPRASVEPYFTTFLRGELARRQRGNPAYSLRSFARQLNMQPPSLSAVLSGKRPLPFKSAVAISETLALSPSERRRFLDSVSYRKASRGAAGDLSLHGDSLSDATEVATTLDEERHFKIIAEWEHYAILSLAETQGFRPDKKWIAKRLGLTETRAHSALSRLIESGLLKVDIKGKARLQQIKVKTQDHVVSSALKQAHREELQLAIDKLDQVALEMRDFSSTTLAVNVGRLDEVSKIIRSFKKQVAQLVEEGQKTEVYQLCVQFFPLTQADDSPAQSKERKREEK